MVDGNNQQPNELIPIWLQLLADRGAALPSEQERKADSLTSPELAPEEADPDPSRENVTE